MLGAIVGDIIGSRFEWHNHKDKDFKLFTNSCHFTDDTVMTLAVAKSLSRFPDGVNDYEDLRLALIKDMHEVGKNYLHCGFGGSFYNWLINDETAPYGSYGNGAAMRVSYVGHYAKSLKEAETLAEITSAVTHNHKEAIKAAKVVAGSIYLARIHKTKKELYAYMSKFYNLNRSVENIRKDYSFDVSCSGSVPEALICFLESDSFEDCIRNAISIGGDSDTIAAIAGSIAESYYGMDDKITKEVKTYLDPYLLDILNKAQAVLEKR